MEFVPVSETLQPAGKEAVLCAGQPDSVREGDCIIRHLAHSGSSRRGNPLKVPVVVASPRQGSKLARGITRGRPGMAGRIRSTTCTGTCLCANTGQGKESPLGAVSVRLYHTLYDFDGAEWRSTGPKVMRTRWVSHKSRFVMVRIWNRKSLARQSQTQCSLLFEDLFANHETGMSRYWYFSCSDTWRSFRPHDVLPPVAPRSAYFAYFRVVSAVGFTALWSMRVSTFLFALEKSS
jgi:hypothetical protein